MKPDTLYYHPNELRGGIPELLPKASSESSLPLDYGWLTDDGLVLVEHKSLNDLAQSLRNGHLVEQIEKAKGVSAHIFLVVTGLPIPSREGQLISAFGEDIIGRWDFVFFCDAVLAAVHGLQICGPIYTSCRRDTATIILELFKQTRRMTLGRGRPVLPKWRTLRGYDQAESYARALPSIGWERAEALANFAPSWSALVGILTKKGPHVLAKRVKGIGPVLSGRIYDLVMEEK